MFGRIVTGAKRGTSHDLLYDELSWQTLAERRNISKAKFVHKLYHGTLPHYLSHLLPLRVDDITVYNLRNGNDLVQFSARTEKFKKSLLPSCIKKWNEFDASIRNDVNTNSFIRNAFPRPIKKPLCSYGISRKLNVIHCQLRLKCSDLKAHLYDMHVIDDAHCICLSGREDSNHFFLYLPALCTSTPTTIQ